MPRSRSCVWSVLPHSTEAELVSCTVDGQTVSSKAALSRCLVTVMTLRETSQIWTPNHQSAIDCGVGLQRLRKSAMRLRFRSSSSAAT